MDPQELLENIAETNVSSSDRRTHVRRAVADPEHTLTKSGRAVGALLYTTTSGTPPEESFINEPIRRTVIEAWKERGKDGAIDVLTRELRARDEETGIYRTLTETDKTQETGAQLREDTNIVIELQATLAGIAEAAAKIGDFATVAHATQEARLNMFQDRPDWFIQTIAQSVAVADVNNPDVRASLAAIRSAQIFPVEQNEQALSAKSSDTLSPIEQINRTLLEARAIDTRLAAEAEAQRAEAEYKNKLKTGMEQKMKNVIREAREGFEEHFKSDKYRVRFTNFAGGTYILGPFLQDTKRRELSKKVFGDEAGIQGYLSVLQKIQSNQSLRKEIVSQAANDTYKDLGERTRKQHEQAGTVSEFEDHIAEQLDVEIVGNAMGVLLETVCLNQNAIDDTTRNQLIRKALNIIGQGNATGFLTKNSHISQAQQLAQANLRAFIQNPLTDREGQSGRAAETKATRLTRLKTLSVQAPIADAEYRLYEAQMITKRKEADTGRTKESTQIGKDLQEIKAATKALQRLPELNETLSRWSESADVMTDWIDIAQTGDTTKPDATLSIRMTEQGLHKLTAIQNGIKTVEEQLKSATGDDRERLMEELEGYRLAETFGLAIQPLVDSVNNNEYKKTNVTKGSWLQGTKDTYTGQISYRAFNDIKELDYGENALVSGFSDKVHSQLTNITQPSGHASLEQLETRYAELKKITDLAPVASELEDMQHSLNAQKLKIQEQVDKLRMELKQIAGLKARIFMKKTVYSALEKQKRLSFV